MLAEVSEAIGLPEGGAFSVLPCTVDNASQLITDERIKLLTFTGSPAVGWLLKCNAGKKRVTLELGGNAAVIVEPDADVDAALSSKIVSGGFSNAGQSCISVQRVYFHRLIWEHAREARQPSSQVVVGDPFDERTLVGPMITPWRLPRK